MGLYSHVEAHMWRRMMDVVWDEYVNGRFPYLLPSLCNTVLAIALLFIVFQLPVCAVLNFLGFLLTLCYN